MGRIVESQKRRLARRRLPDPTLFSLTRDRKASVTLTFLTRPFNTPRRLSNFIVTLLRWRRLSGRRWNLKFDDCQPSENPFLLIKFAKLQKFRERRVSPTKSPVLILVIVMRLVRVIMLVIRRRRRRL